MILCYSGTGNTLYVAERIADSTGEKLFRIGFDFELSCDDGLLGICVPVYFCGLPESAEKYLKSLQISGDPYIFLVSTCGGMSGNIAGSVRKILSDKGHKLSAAFDIEMPDNFIKLYDVPEDVELENLRLSSDKELEEIISHIKKRDFGSFQHHRGVFPHILTPIVRSMYDTFGRNTDKFVINDKCINCLKCLRNCPSGSIVCDGKGIEWSDKKCDGCLACVHLCPVQALDYGRITVGKKRYKHISYKER